MKKLILYAAVILFASSCSRGVYSFTNNDITTTGVVHAGHHVETISTARVRFEGSK
jgi:hypothetical protein